MRDPEVLLATPRFNVVRQWYRTPDEVLHARETILHPGAVTIVPLLADDRVVLIRNFRPAVGQVLIELPAGTLEPGEDPLLAAGRELEEETGYRSSKIEPLGQFFMSPGILRERMHLFVAAGLVPGPMRLDQGEQIEPLAVSWAEAMSMVDDGRIEDAKTLVGLLRYQRWRSSGGSGGKDPDPRDANFRIQRPSGSP